MLGETSVPLNLMKRLPTILTCPAVQLYPFLKPISFNSLQVDVECRRKAKIFQLFKKISKFKFSLLYWNQHDTYIKMSKHAWYWWSGSENRLLNL